MRRRNVWFWVEMVMVFACTILLIPGLAAFWKNIARERGHVNWGDTFESLEGVSMIAMVVAIIGLISSIFIGVAGMVIAVGCLLIYAIAFLDFFVKIKAYNRFLISPKI